MTSLRLALKQSLEETSGGTSPAPPSQQVAPVAGRASPHDGASVSVNSQLTEEDPTLSAMPRKRGPGRPRKHPRTGDQTPRKRGRPRKHPIAGDGDEDGFSSENEFSVGEDHESEQLRHQHSADPTLATAASKIQSHWKKNKGNAPESLSGAVAAPVASHPSKQHGHAKEAATTQAAPVVNQSKPVTPPAPEVIDWMRHLSIKRARKAVSPGLRVKVRFLTNKKKDGRIVRKRIWYGGKITQVSKEGSKIKIKYDDKTSEVTQFPDKDVVIDDYMNGTHHAKADRFIPPENDGNEDDEENTFQDEHEPKVPPSSAAGERQTSTGENRGIPQTPVTTGKAERRMSETKPKLPTGEEKPTSTPGKAGFILRKSVAEKGLVSSSVTEPSQPGPSQFFEPERKMKEPPAVAEINVSATAAEKASVSIVLPDVSASVESPGSPPKPAEPTATEQVNTAPASSSAAPPNELGVYHPPSPAVEDVPMGNDKPGIEADNSAEKLSDAQPMELDKVDDSEPEARQMEIESTNEGEMSAPTAEVEKLEESPALETVHAEEAPSMKLDQSPAVESEVPEVAKEGQPDEGSNDRPEIPKAEKVIVEESTADNAIDTVADGTGQATSSTPAQTEEREEIQEAVTSTETKVIAASLSPRPASVALDEKSDVPKPSDELDPRESKTADVDSVQDTLHGEEDVKEGTDEPRTEEEKDPVSEDLLEQAMEEDLKPKRKRGRPPKQRPNVAPPSEEESLVQSESTALVRASKSTESGDGSPTKPSLTIRIPDGKKIPDEHIGSEETETLRPKKRASDDLEDEPPAKRLHIHIGSKHDKPNQQPEKPVASPKQSKDLAVSPRPKKLKRKRDPDVDALPSAGVKAVDKHSGKVEDLVDKVPAEVRAETGVNTPTPDNTNLDTTDGTTKADLLLAARSGRRAAQQANERISSKNDVPPDQMGKKKKKKRREREDGEVELEQEKWVQCDKCKKWRIIPSSAVDSLPEVWYCADNIWDPKRASCDVREQTDKEVLKLRKRKKRKLMMEREAAEAAAAERGRDAGEGGPVAATTHPSNNDGAKVSDRASPAAISTDAGRETIEPLKTEKKSSVATKKTKQPISGTPVPAVPEEEPKPRGRGRPRRNPPKEPSTPSAPPASSNNIPSRPEEADNVEWVQCEKCEKWRKLPPHISADELPDVWYCSMNTWNPGAASCSAPEDKADGLQDIFNANSTGKLSYRNLIFGSNGRKHNRPISERTRAAESLFAAVSDDPDAPPTVMYANSSSFVCRGKSQNLDENQPGLLDVMAGTHFWTSLHKSQASAGPIIFDDLSAQAREALKDIVLHHVEAKTMTGEELHQQVQERNWDSAPAGWAAVRKYCTEDMLVMAMCSLVRLGVLECYRLDGPFADGQLWTLCYRRAKVRSPVPTSTVSPPETTIPPLAGSSRCMKISKPWKRSAGQL